MAYLNTDVHIIYVILMYFILFHSISFYGLLFHFISFYIMSYHFKSIYHRIYRQVEKTIRHQARAQTATTKIGVDHTK